MSPPRAVLGSALVGAVGCFSSTAIEFPDIDLEEHAVIVAAIGPDDRLLGEASTSLAMTPIARNEADQVVVIEYTSTFGALQAAPPLLAERGSGGEALRQLKAFPVLNRPLRLWRLGGDGFVAEPGAELPAAVAELWIGDRRECPDLVEDVVTTSRPVQALAKISESSVVAVLRDGQLAQLTLAPEDRARPPWTSIERAVVGVPTSSISALWSDDRGRLVAGDYSGGLWSLDTREPAPTYRMLQAASNFGDCEVHAIDGAPDGSEVYTVDRCGRVSRISAGTSTVVGQVGPVGERPFNHRIGWVGPGEVLITWRFSKPGHGVTRLCWKDDRASFDEEPFGPDLGHRPNALAAVNGRWVISGELGGDSITRRALFDFSEELDRWEPTADHGITTGAVFVMTSAPRWRGFALGVQRGLLALQPDFKSFQPCLPVKFRDRNVRSLIAVDNGQLVVSFEQLAEVGIYTSLDPAPPPPVPSPQPSVSRCPN